MTIAVLVFLGVVVGFGGVLVVRGIVGLDDDEIAPPPRGRPAGGRGRTIDRIQLRVALAVVAAVLVGAVTQWPMAALLAGAGAFVLPSIVGGKAERERELAVIEGVASWAEMLRDTMAAAGGLEQSILASAAVAPPAIRPQVAALAVRLERDRLPAALRQFAVEVDDPTADLVVAALLLAADKSPRRLGELLGTLGRSARAEVNMRLRVEAGRARSRTSVRVVSIATAVFAIGLLVLNRGYLDPYDTALGQAVLGLVGGCFGAAFWWMAGISRHDPVERFLAQPEATP